MKTLLIALSALVLAAPALAAPPTNDNRADAQSLPTFPSSAHGTTGDATLERLDPQVSRCGRIDGTVWYEIEAAPDGTIVATVQAAGQLAPVVRIYRRNPSNIEEVSCGSAPAGGKVVTSVGTVRGAGYLILVGRRPGAANGEFDLRADLVLPPGNDERGEAERLGRLPATVRGSTLGATYDYGGGCSAAGGTVWYRVKGPATGRLLVQLSTGERDGVVAAFRRSRSELQSMGCAATNRRRESPARFRDEGRRRLPDRGRRQERLGPGRLRPDTSGRATRRNDCRAGRCRNEARTRPCTGSPTSTTSGRYACDAGRCTGSRSARSPVRTRRSGGRT